MTRKLQKNIAEFSRQIGRLGVEIGGKSSLQTVTAEECSEPAKKSQALILADEILNRLNGYARKRSRTRKNSYSRDLNWMTDVLMRVAAGERNPLRPTGQ